MRRSKTGYFSAQGAVAVSQGEARWFLSSQPVDNTPAYTSPSALEGVLLHLPLGGLASLLLQPEQTSLSLKWGREGREENSYVLGIRSVPGTMREVESILFSVHSHPGKGTELVSVETVINPVPRSILGLPDVRLPSCN